MENRVEELTANITANEILRFESYLKSESGNMTRKYVTRHIANNCCGGNVILFLAWRSAREQACDIVDMEENEAIK